MADATMNQLQDLIGRLRSGDAAVRDAARWELLERGHRRLRALASQILGDFPRLRANDGLWRTTEVAGELRVRLARALETVPLADPQHFFRLAAQHVRWLLLDLVRRLPQPPEEGGPAASGQVVDWGGVTDALMELLPELPDEQYAVLDLEFSLGFTDVEIAETLGVDEKTVRRRRRRAYEELAAALRRRFPELGGGGG